ncbi:MAG: amidase domain-containing protein [Clostridia bacterium]|nr:amidase domain-containing protein [Clostridia bacterium]
MREIEYNRQRAIIYAFKWAYRRNPDYYDFSDIGGDCTNFVSQCIFAGLPVMNYSPLLGWYYISSDDRAPAWTSVNFLYEFLTENTGYGPYGKLVEIQNAKEGDIVQYKAINSDDYTHTMIITGKLSNNTRDVFVTAHTFDTKNRPLYLYSYSDIRFIHIEGGRIIQ